MCITYIHTYTRFKWSLLNFGESGTQASWCLHSTQYSEIVPYFRTRYLSLLSTRQDLTQGFFGVFSLYSGAGWTGVNTHALLNYAGHFKYYCMFFIISHLVNRTKTMPSGAKVGWSHPLDAISPWFTLIENGRTSYHIYQPLRLGRIWHKVNF